jgi:Uncharacterized protein conserved in bacteria (DUF2087)
MNVTTEPTSNTLPAARLTALVVKHRAGLGTLTAAERELALAITAAALPAGGPGCSEAEVNRALQRCLQNEAAFLATDHVELRRWLVDSGHWQRDGFGRRYERAPLAGLLPERADALRALAGLDLPTWVAAQRAQDAERRDARRRAWVNPQREQAARVG